MANNFQYWNIRLIIFFFININLFSQNNFWVETTDFTNSTISSIVSDTAGVIYAGTYGAGVFRTTDKGENWIQINTGLTNTTVSCIRISSKGYIFAGTQSEGVFRSTNQGESWQYIGLSEWTMKSHSLSFDSNDNIYSALYFLGGGGIAIGRLLRSTNDGTTWVDTLVNYVVFAVNINNNDDIFIIATLGANVFRSLDGGATFQPLIININWDGGNSITFGSSNEVYFARDLGIARSLNNGDDWTIVNNGLTELHIGTIVMNKTETLFAASYYGGGVFCSTNKGDTWTQLNSNLTDLNVYSMTIDSSGILYIGTESGKVFRSLNSTNSVNNFDDNFPHTLILEQNYPNPFNSKTKISFYIPSQSFVTLKIFDLTGKEIASLVSNELSQGYHIQEWDATNYSSGVYFYRLQAGNFVAIKKMILLR